MPTKMNRATVRKLVRVGGKSQGKESDGLFQSGYGLLRNERDQVVYFVDSAVENKMFSKLEVGDVVYYIAEEGPFLRAAEVRFTQEPLTDLSLAATS